MVATPKAVDPTFLSTTRYEHGGAGDELKWNQVRCRTGEGMAAVVEAPQATGVRCLIQVAVTSQWQITDEAALAARTF